MRLRKSVILLVISIFVLALFGCNENVSKSPIISEVNEEDGNYKGRTFYEIFVRAFNDSNGDGVGDLKGVTDKLDYLEDLGIKGIWLMPITKSASYHGYDTVDYYSIQEEYGTIDDLKELIEEANKRDIKVIMDLVLNHTSTEHPWFIDARKNIDSEYRDYYIWESDMSKIDEISTMDTKRWTQNGDKEELYNAIFWGGMPDLNFDNEKVIEETKKIAKYYLDLGIDGFRLDAVKWIYEDKDKNIEFWNDFNKYVKSVDEDAVLVGEVWDKPAAIFEYAEPLDSFFEFSIGDDIVSAIKNSTLSYFPQKFNEWNDKYTEVNPDFSIANFLSNHDQSRIMSRLQEEYKAKIAAALYLTLPGTPYIYYGEELGMMGVKPDERIREPFIWSSTDESLNTNWIDITNDVSKVALDVQIDDPDSMYNTYKDILKVKNENISLRLGKVSSIECGNRKVLVMERTYEDDRTLVILNSSRVDQAITLDKEGYSVLYDNKEYKVGDKLPKDLTLKSGEILIVK